MRFQLPGIVLECIFASINIYFTAMEKAYITTTIQVVFIPFHIFWCHFFVNIMEYDYLGCALAIDLTQTLSMITLLIYCKVSKDTELK